MRRALVVLAAFLIGASGVYALQSVTYANNVRIAHYWTSLAGFDSLTGGQAGGHTRTFIAGDSLRIGDAVYDTLGNRVTKSATLVSYNKLAGCVVGGTRTSNRGAINAAGVGTLAATANQRVIVLQSGRCWMKTADSVYPGDQVIPSTAVAGTIRRRTTAIDTFHRVIGRAVFTEDSGSAVLIDVRIK